MRRAPLWAVLLPLGCPACGDAPRHTTAMIECLRRVENHTRAALRTDVAKRECGYAPSGQG